MVVNPITIGPDATLADALALMRANRISGIPVVAKWSSRAAASGPAGRHPTDRDVRFATNERQKFPS